MTSVDPRTFTKILIIDADPGQRAELRALLEAKYLVLEANNGINGIDLANDTEPDLIYIDIALPDLSGFEAATRLKTLLPQTPIVALAEVAFFESTHDFGIAVGFSGYVQKPFLVDQVEKATEEYLAGKRDAIENQTEYLVAHQSQLASRLEEKVREMANVSHRANFLIEQNSRMIETLKRRQLLLENAAYVSKNITSILDLEELLAASADIICEGYQFYYAGIFLIDENNEWAVLRAGHGAAGKAMIEAGHKLAVGGESMIGTAINQRNAQIALDVGLETTHFKNPHLPDTRSEMALPLIVKGSVLGAITVQSTEPNAFSDDDITALQVLADQLAIAINNAQLLLDLESANQELVRNKTYEAIATATGEAIHWVGNKAAPIPGSVTRVRDDLYSLLGIVKRLLEMPDSERQEHAFWSVFEEIFEIAKQNNIELDELANDLADIPANRLPLIIGIESIIEDLEIIENSANTILRIKEDLIGPARQQKKESFDLSVMLQQTAKGMGYPKGVINTHFEENTPPVVADPRQIDRVFINLIKNAWEAMDGSQPDPKIDIYLERAADPAFSQVKIKDNGPGIAPENLEKIWVSFFTTKKEKGGTGLGLSACMEIVQQSGGKISVDSEVGEGTTFSVTLPIAKKDGNLTNA